MNSLSQPEIKFIKDGIAEDFRSDGRGRFDYRSFDIELGTISQASGSARFKLNTTDILVGVKAEIGTVDPEFPEKGKVICSVECSPSASQEFEGKGAQEINNELSESVQRILAQDAAIDLHKLCVIPGKHCWVLYIDTLVLDDGGNLIDSIMMAIKAALANTRIPQVNIVMSDGIPEIEMPDDPNAYFKLDLSKIPVTVTLNQIGDRYVVDSSLSEELCIDSKVVVAINKEGHILAIKKTKNGSLNPSVLLDMIHTAKSAASALITRLDELVETCPSRNGLL